MLATSRGVWGGVTAISSMLFFAHHAHGQSECADGYCSGASGYDCCTAAELYCTPSGYCTTESTSGGNGGGGGGGGTCPDSAPLYCSNFDGCCPTNMPYCGDDGRCYASSGGSGGSGGGGGGTCPDSAPLYCSNFDGCCPTNMPYCGDDGRCYASSGGGGGGAAPSGYTCSTASNISNANCGYVRFCVSSDLSDAYYEADGYTFQCPSPSELTGCAQDTAEYCAGSGSSSSDDDSDDDDDGGESLCSNSCQYAYDGTCDDGGDGSEYSLCDYGTDCADCSARSDDGCNAVSDRSATPIRVVQSLLGVAALFTFAGLRKRARVTWRAG